MATPKPERATTPAFPLDDLFVEPERQTATEGRCILVYGQPGVGKTSWALTAPSPLLLSFDASGASRAMFRATQANTRTWDHVMALFDPANRAAAERLASVKTIVIDTIEDCLTVLMRKLGNDDPSLLKKSGQPQLAGYGAMKVAFEHFLDDLRRRGLNVILIAHDKTEGDEGSRLTVPKITGGSYDKALQVADMMGWYHMTQVDGQQRRVIDWDPTMYHVGKNCAGLAPTLVPDFGQGADQPGNAAWVIAQTNDAMDRMHAATADITAELAEWQALADQKSVAELTDLYVNLTTDPTGGQDPTWRCTISYPDRVRALVEQRVRAWVRDNVFATGGDVASADDLNACRAKFDTELNPAFHTAAGRELKRTADKLGIVVNAAKKRFEDPQPTPPPASPPAHKGQAALLTDASA